MPPFRGHFHVMHRGRFAGTFRDACRFVDYPAPLSDAEASREGEGSFEEYVDDEEEQERF
jgi:hypothetical protein